MKIIKTRKEWFRERKKTGGGTLGFVPTMGALHEGHMSLVTRSRKENAFTCASVFINPPQFNDKKDLENYPVSSKEDIAELKKEKTDFLFAPQYREIYPGGYRFIIRENKISRTLCGARRPGHFEGVMTVVMKLLNIIRPNKAYFGEKDYQQYVLIKEMCGDFFLPVEIVLCPTFREKDGLAMSSRNRLLSKEEREKAPLLYKALKKKKTDTAARNFLERAGFEVEYVEKKWGRRFAAARLGKARLIDNVKA